MGTRIEYFFQTPDGPVKDNRFPPVVLHNNSTFFDFCNIKDEECLVEIADEDGETIVEIVKNDSGKEFSVDIPGESFEFKLMDKSPEPEPTRIVSVTHTHETPANGTFVFSLN